MINLKKRNPFGAAAAAATLLYRKRNISRYVVSAGASTIFPAPFLSYFLSRPVEKIPSWWHNFFSSFGTSIGTYIRAIFSQWSLYNRMKRIGGSRSYRRLSIEALKKKRGGPSVVCMQRRMGRSSTPKKISIYRVSFLRGQVKKRPDYPFPLLYRVQTHIHNGKKICKLDGTVLLQQRV